MDEDSAIAAYLASPQRPYQKARSYFRFSLTTASPSLSVIIAPNELVTHSQLFAIVVGQCFCYVGPRQTYLTYDMPNAQAQWNRILQRLQGHRIVVNDARARSLAALLFAFATGEYIAPRPGALDYSVVVHKDPRWPGSPHLQRIEGPIAVYRLDEDWVVSAKWRKKRMFRARFQTDGVVRELELTTH